MSPENKQRIVGVIVLLGFIALLIPFLFTGKKERHPLAESEVVIPGQNSSADQVMEVDVVDMQQPANDQASEPQNVEVISNVLSSPEHAERPNIFPQTLETMPPIEDIETSKPAPIVKTAPQSVAKKVIKSVPQKKKVAKVKSKKTVNSSKVWSVQVGSFSNHSFMQRMVDKLQAAGFHTYLQKITTSQGEMVRVLVGHEPTKAQAVELSKQLKTKLDLDGRIIGNNK